MINRRNFSAVVLAGAASALTLNAASAQGTIKIGEMNSYKAQPAFLDPYKKGWELAIEEINAAGGVLGKKLEVVSRDDGGNPGDAVRVAEELFTRENVAILTGTFLSHVGLAVTEYAGRNKKFFLASEPLTDKITWQNACRFYRFDPFQHTTREQATVGALRALATDVDTSTTSKAQYRERYAAHQA